MALRRRCLGQLPLTTPPVQIARSVWLVVATVRCGDLAGICTFTPMSRSAAICYTV
jgi:hypothetical protein